MYHALLQLISHHVPHCIPMPVRYVQGALFLQIKNRFFGATMSTYSQPRHYRPVFKPVQTIAFCRPERWLWYIPRFSRERISRDHTPGQNQKGCGYSLPICYELLQPYPLPLPTKKSLLTSEPHAFYNSDLPG